MTLIRSSKNACKHFKPQQIVSRHFPRRSLSTTPAMSSYSVSRYHSPLDVLFNHPVFGIVQPFVDASDDHSLAQRHQVERSRWAKSAPEFFNGPRVDLVKDKDGYVLTAEVPSLRKEDIHLNVDEKARRLTLSGEIKSTFSNLDQAQESGSESKDVTPAAVAGKNDHGPRVLIQERMQGSFSRSWSMPESADLSSVSARVQDGILTVRIKNVEKKKVEPRTVTIEDGEDE